MGCKLIFPCPSQASLQYKQTAFCPTPERAALQWVIKSSYLGLKLEEEHNYLWTSSH